MIGDHLVSARGASFLTCSGNEGIQRSPYAHQVTLSAFALLTEDAFKLKTEYLELKK